MTWSECSPAGAPPWGVDLAEGRGAGAPVCHGRSGVSKMSEQTTVVSLPLPPLNPLCIFANKEGCMESDLGSSHTTMVEWANERHTGPHVSCEAGDGAHWDRGGGTLGPGRIGSEMFARGSWHVQGCQHPAVFNIYKNKTRTLKVKQ